MFIINVALGNTSWRLLFKEEEKARETFIFINSSPDDFRLRLEDDFGQTFSGYRHNIHGVMLEDMDKTKMAHVEMALHQARTQNLATRMAQHDPALKANSTMGGPSVLNPVGNGFMPRQN